MSQPEEALIEIREENLNIQINDHNLLKENNDLWTHDNIQKGNKLVTTKGF